MKIKASKKIIMAALALLMAVGLAAGSTFAWFSMNNRVTVTGMEVRTKVSSNLMISETTDENDFGTSLIQSVSGTLEPVSTTTGSSFFYHSTTEHVAASGKQDNNVFVEYNEDTALENTSAKKENYDNEFQVAYGNADSVTTSNVTYGYVDYTFYLKATSTEDDQKVSLTTCRLLYNNNPVDNDDSAWRVVVLKTAGQDTAAAAEAAGLSVLSILKPTDAANQTPTKAATSTSALGDVTYGTAATIDSGLDSGVTKYYKVVVRLFLEGEDTTCNNSTYAELTSQPWSLNLAFKVGSDAGTTYVAKSVVEASSTTNTATVTKVNNDETATNYQWKLASDNSDIPGATEPTYENDGAAKDVYCVVTTASGSYKSNVVAVAAAA